MSLKALGESSVKRTNSLVYWTVLGVRRPKCFCQLHLFLAAWPGECAYVSQSSSFIHRTIKTLNQSVPQSCKIWAQLLKPFATLHGSFQDACSQFLVLLDAWVTESHSSGFVPSALSPGSSKCARCTESWGAHTQREGQMATNLLAFKKIPVWLLQQSSGRSLCPEERKQVKKSRLPAQMLKIQQTWPPCPGKGSSALA